MNLVFFVEDQSTKAMLNGLLPRLLPKAIKTYIIAFEGKSDLENQLPVKLRGWRIPDSEFIVIRDQDSGNCVNVKNKLASICMDAGKTNTLVRIACHELESWYLGDLLAVELGLQIPDLSSHQNKAKYRRPDALNNAKDELIHLTKSRYQEVGGSRSIGHHLRLDSSNASQSFQILLSGIRRVARIQ